MNKELQSDWQHVLDGLCFKDRVLLSKTFDNKEKVRACYSDSFIYKTLYQWLTAHSNICKSAKSDKIAAECRIKGNGFYLKRDIDQSLYYYTRAVLLAPANSEELRLAFGNRSAALFNIGKYEESVSDIKYAVTTDKTPCSRDIKLLIRKAKALEKLNMSVEAMDAYQVASKIILNINYPDKEKLEKLKHEIDQGLNKFKPPTLKQAPLECKEDEFKLIRDNFESEPDFPNASSALNLMKNETKGRHVIAKKKISAGEVLFLEKPFAFVILPNFSYERCQACCKHIINPLPCEHCSEACFCNEECRNQAWNIFHKWECGFGLDLNYMIGIAHLGFRVAITGLTNSVSSNYEKVRKLQDHIQYLEDDDLYQYTLTATVLVIYLEKFTNILKEIDNVESLLEIGGLILLHIAQMVCNGHAITDVILTSELGNEKMFSEEQVRIATAIYPSASMMNHSCDPSIINGFKDQYLIVRAIKDIKKGDEVYNCYGPNFRRMTREERRSSLLQQYMFWCECEQCISEEDFIQRFMSYKCRKNQCNGIIPEGVTKCPRCSTIISEKCINIIEKARDYMKSAKNAAIEQNFQGSVDIAEVALKAFVKYLYRHNKDILECKDFLAQILIPLGRYYESYKYVEENILGNKERFGKKSIEVANEIVKLVDIASEVLKKTLDGGNKTLNYELRAVFDNIHKYGGEALEIFRLHYGNTNKKYKELQEQMILFQTINPTSL